MDTFAARGAPHAQKEEMASLLPPLLSVPALLQVREQNQKMWLFLIQFSSCCVANVLPVLCAVVCVCAVVVADLHASN